MRFPNVGSLYSLYLEPIAQQSILDPEINLGSATGCLYEFNGKIYLITNWHVLSGRNSISRVSLDKSCARPTHLKVHFPSIDDLNVQIIHTYPLKDSGNNFLWLEHPFSNLVDVAAFEIVLPKQIGSHKISDVDIKNAPFMPNDFFHLTQDVWVIGYPRGIRFNDFPIWKKATIASEFSVSDDAEKYRIIIDTATREGMSGSPVLYMGGDIYNHQIKGGSQAIEIPTFQKLLGIYSGRIKGDDALADQLGIVWLSDCIPEIINANKPYVE